jgi:hypothetical protein
MLFQKPVRRLMEAQLDCDVIPADILEDSGTEVCRGKLSIQDRDYGSLVIPYCDHIPEPVVRFVSQAAGSELPVYMLEALPLSDTCGRQLPEAFVRSVTVVPLEELACLIRSNQEMEINISGEFPDLRFMCYRQEDGKVYMFMNESTDQRIGTKAVICNGQYGSIGIYDAQDNVILYRSICDNTFDLTLEPGQAVFILLEHEPSPEERPYVESDSEFLLSDMLALDLDWTVSTAEVQQYPSFAERWKLKKGEPLPNLNSPGYDTGFSGYFRYEGTFELEKAPDGRYRLRFPGISDCARVLINGCDSGMIIGSPYSRDVSRYVQNGFNKITVEGSNTLVWKVRDGASTHLQLEPTGITEIPILEIWRK